MLTLLPPIGHKCQLVQDTVNEEMDIKVLVLQTLVDALRDNAGFHIPKVPLSHMITHLEYVVNTYCPPFPFKCVLSIKQYFSLARSYKCNPLPVNVLHFTNNSGTR